MTDLVKERGKGKRRESEKLKGAGREIGSERGNANVREKKKGTLSLRKIC